MPNLSNQEYEFFKKLIKKALDSKYFTVRKDLLTFDDNKYKVILEHNLSSENLLVNIDYKIDSEINNKTTNISVSKINDNKIIITTAIPMDFYVTIESNVFTVLSDAETGGTSVIKAGNNIITGNETICGSEISNIQNSDISIIKPTALNI